jgi:hypothetical protein|tara:strand:+ start:668 stop:1627 length:960 start_codon:yes stop_codon:yes gene_type:complete
MSNSKQQRKDRDFSGFSEEQLEKLRSSGALDVPSQTGVGNTQLVEPVPVYEKGGSDVVMNNSNNAWIVLGRDRPSTLQSGYGGKGSTQAGAIDIVVGRMSGTGDGPQADRLVSPNFFTDAARIYISQKTDIDANFALVGDSRPTTRSGIGIKADAVRVVGREGVKIVTGKCKNVEGLGEDGEKNSIGGKIQTIAGIELIAGNDVGVEELEPLVKGYALRDCLVAMNERIKELTNTVNEIAKTQTKINNSIAKHTHQMGNITIPPSVDMGSDVATKEMKRMSNVHENIYKSKVKQLMSFEEEYLSPKAPGWFGSRWNKTN